MSGEVGGEFWRGTGGRVGAGGKKSWKVEAALRLLFARNFYLPSTFHCNVSPFTGILKAQVGCVDCINCRAAWGENVCQQAKGMEL